MQKEKECHLFHQHLKENGDAIYARLLEEVNTISVIPFDILTMCLLQDNHLCAKKDMDMDWFL